MVGPTMSCDALATPTSLHSPTVPQDSPPRTTSQRKKLKLQQARREREQRERERREREEELCQQQQQQGVTKEGTKTNNWLETEAHQISSPAGPLVDIPARPNVALPSLLLDAVGLPSPSTTPPVSKHVPPPPPPPPFKSVRADLICQVHLEILNGGSFADANLHLYARRNRTGGPYAPRALAVNKRILEAASPEFEKYVFAEPAQADSDGYQDDSDLEDEDDNESETPGSLTVASTMDSDYRDLQTPVEEDITTRFGDADLLSDDEGDRTQQPSERSTPSRGSHVGRSCADQPRVLDGAYKTWQAMSLYLYTDHIKFNPIRSFIVNTPHAAHQTGEVGKARHSPCSPKSMYRLADKLKLPELREQAQTALSSYLTEHNIVDELFSDFTWRYPDILQSQTDIFYRHSAHPSVQAAMRRIFARVATGELPHSNVILEALFGKLVRHNGPQAA